MKRIFLFLFSLLLLLPAQAVKKSSVSVLYVGGQADVETAATKVDKDVLAQSVKTRMAAWDKYLRAYFKTVKSINGMDYKPEMSNQYDVTIFDGRIPKLRPAMQVKDADPLKTIYLPAQYLPDDFDRANITIASIGEDLGRSLGSKNDWYCLCLDADAHHSNLDHPIFKGPYKTNIVLKDKPTPEDAFHYSYFYDKPLEPTTKMWTVQTKGYQSHKGFLVGMVARPWGYTDSPECEAISSGVCAKTIDAVAIGRDANSLHWGFSASPADMTPSAKAVFANAVVYMAQFNGKKPIARKYNERQSTKEYIKERRYMATYASFQERLKSDSIWEAQMLELQEKAKAKKAKGETLDEDENYALDYKPEPPCEYADYLRRYQSDELFNVFGEDEQAYLKFYDDNYDYFYGGTMEMYYLVVDQDAKSLGIANTDKRLIDKAISLWEHGQQVAKAKRILYRYTLLRYDNPKQFREWFDKYQDRLFFTQSGGWFWLVDSDDPATPGNDYSVVMKPIWDKAVAKQTTKPVAKPAPKMAEPTQANPVVATAVLEQKARGPLVRIDMKIYPGFHIYNKVSDKDPYIPTTVSFELPDGVELNGELIVPKFKQLDSNGTTIFEDDVTFRQPIKGSGKGTIKVKLNFQACDAHVCLPPKDLIINVPIE